MKNRIDDDGSIEAVLQCRLFDLQIYRAQSCDKTKKGEKKIEECFQRKTIVSCSRRNACSFLHTHVTGDREDNVE